MGTPQLFSADLKSVQRSKKCLLQIQNIPLDLACMREQIKALPGAGWEPYSDSDVTGSRPHFPVISKRANLTQITWQLLFTGVLYNVRGWDESSS